MNNSQLCIVCLSVYARLGVNALLFSFDIRAHVPGVHIRVIGLYCGYGDVSEYVTF